MKTRTSHSDYHLYIFCRSLDTKQTMSGNHESNDPSAKADTVEEAGLGGQSSTGLESDSLPAGPIDQHHALHRGLSTRQVSMIAIGGTIGTGLFLGTGRSLAQGGPASMLICYSIVGFIVYVTLLLLGEMATQYPVAGSFIIVSNNSLGSDIASFDRLI